MTSAPTILDRDPRPLVDPKAITKCLVKRMFKGGGRGRCEVDGVASTVLEARAVASRALGGVPSFVNETMSRTGEG